jgi:hypothetical protein
VVVSKDKSVKKSSTKKRKKSSRKKPIISEPSAGREDAMQENNEIPKFDLAEQIMAEHRKNTAIKRKGPAKKAKIPQKQHPAELIAREVKPGPIVSGRQQIIAEIVARDIENLCMGNTP